MRLPTTPRSGAVTGPAVSPNTLQAAASNFALAALCSASLLVTPLPSSAADSVNDAIIGVSQSSYPILKSLRTETFGPFSEKVGKLLLDINPDKLGKSIGLGIDVLTSAPPEKLDAFKGVVKESFAGLDPKECTLVPLVSPSVADKFSALASEKVDASKLKAFEDAYVPTLKSLPKTDDKSAICLPSPEKLDKLALAQAELARSFASGPSELYAAYTTPVLKSSITIGKVLPLVSDAKKLTPTATPSELAAFQTAGKKVEAAATAEAQRVKYEKLRERSAAIAAAKAAGQPAPGAAAGGGAVGNPVLQEELAAQRAEAAKKAAAAKEAQIKAAAEQKEALKKAEAERIAALKAKSAAIQAAKEAK